MGQRFDVAFVEFAGTRYPNRIVKLFHGNAHLLQLGGNRLQMLGNHIFHQDIPAGGSGSHHIGSCLNLIRNNGIRRAAQIGAAVNFNHIGACAANICSHGIEEVGQINNMGLLCRVLNHRRALDADSGKHDIHGCAHRNNVQIDTVSNQLRSAHVHHTALQAVSGSKRRKALKMLVNRTHAEIAPSGHRHHRMVKTSQQSAQKIIGAANMACQLIRRHTSTHSRRINLNGGASDRADLGSHIL